MTNINESIEIKNTNRYQWLIDSLNERDTKKLFYPCIKGVAELDRIIDDYEAIRSDYEEFFALIFPHPPLLPSYLELLKDYVMIFIEVGLDGGKIHVGGEKYPIWLLAVDSSRIVGRDTIPWLFGEYGVILEVISDD